MRLAILTSFAFVLALTFAAPVAAQFGQFEWTLDDSQGGFSILGDEAVVLAGDFSEFSGAVLEYTTSSSVAGRIHVQSLVMPMDGVCSGNSAFVIVGASSSTYATCNFSDQLQFDVEENQTFGFGLKTVSLGFPFTNHLTEFEFDAYWRDVGGALAGGSGAPLLKGTGIVQPTQTIGLSLANAAPSAPAALIVGFTPVLAPFKGGVLVPSPDLVITGLTTSPTGGLSFSSTLPANTPVNFVFVSQFWIVDAGGPAGFAASNAVVAKVLP